MFDLVDVLLKSLPRGAATSPTLRERYKAFCLHKWERDGWQSDEPQLILATLQDHVPKAQAEFVVPQAAAQILRGKVKESTTLPQFYRLVDQTFPEGFETAKERLVELGKEFESPSKIVRVFAEQRIDDFRLAVLEAANSIEQRLPQLKVEVTEPSVLDDDEDEEDLDGDESEVTFSARELRDAFGGSWKDWERLTLQEDAEVMQFLDARNGSPPTRSAGAKTPVSMLTPSPRPSTRASRGSTRATKQRKVLDTAPPEKPAPKKSAASAGKKKKKKVPPSPGKRGVGMSPGSGERKRRFWSHEEELDLVRGVKKYGKGKWKPILQDDNFEFNERSTTDLKDKYRNLEKRISEFEEELRVLDHKPRGGKKQARGAGRRNRDNNDSPARDDEEDDNDDDDDDVDDDEALRKRVKEEPRRNDIREQALENRSRRLAGL